MKRLCLLAVFFLSLPPSSRSSPNSAIVWYLPDLPPSYIVRGEYKGKGYSDIIQGIIIHSLPDYTHNVVLANFARILKALEDNENVCCASLLKSDERQKFIEYSIPHLVLLPNRLILKEEDKELLTPYLSKENYVDLEQLLQTGTFVVGVDKGREYGRAIDKVIDRHSGGIELYERASGDQFRGLLNLLMMNDRNIHGIVGYVDELQYLKGKTHIGDTQLVSFQVQGNLDYILGFIGCSKSALGKKVIQDVNQIVRENRKNSFAGAYQGWLDDKGRKAHEELTIKIFSDHRN